MSADSHHPTDQGTEKQVTKPGDKPPAGAAITSKDNNAIQQRAQIRNAIKSHRITTNPDNPLRIDMGDGKVDQDGRPLPAAKTAEQAPRTSDTDYKPQKTGDHSYALGVNRQEAPDTRTPAEKLQDFMQAAAKRATDPEGWKAWAQGEINKFSGIGAGLNEAKDETKEAVAAAWKAMTDGTVIEFLSQPNAINAPVFKSVENAFEAMSEDPEAVNKALEALGKVVMKASEGYSNLPDAEKGKVIGKVMFGMINPEGDIKDAEATLKIGDTIATNVDKAVWDTAAQAMKAAEQTAKSAPELAQQTKQMLLDYLTSKGLRVPELGYAGVPKGYFDGMKPTEAVAKDNYLAMSKTEEGERLPQRAEGGKDSVPEKLPPSEAFKVELKQALDGFSEQEKDFLRQHGIEIKPLKRITDVPDINQNVAGCYKPKENAIYVPEEFLQRGGWTQNNDLAFILRHEFGHAFNANKGRFGEWLSNDKRFARVFTEDFSKVPPAVRDTLFLSDKFKPLELARDEVFSDMYAHASGLQSNNPYSQLMKKFFPSCLNYLENMPKW